MHCSPILAYFFELSGMSSQAFALAQLAQVNSGESWTWFSPTSSLSVGHLQFVSSDCFHFSDWISHHFCFVFVRHISGTAQCCHVSLRNKSRWLFGGKFETFYTLMNTLVRIICMSALCSRIFRDLGQRWCKKNVHKKSRPQPFWRGCFIRFAHIKIEIVRQ